MLCRHGTLRNAAGTALPPVRLLSSLSTLSKNINVDIEIINFLLDKIKVLFYIYKRLVFTHSSRG
jgi:hypothetical protein